MYDASVLLWTLTGVSQLSPESSLFTKYVILSLIYPGSCLSSLFPLEGRHGLQILNRNPVFGALIQSVGTPGTVH